MSARNLGVGSVVWDNTLTCEAASGGDFVDIFRSRRRHKVGIRRCPHWHIVSIISIQGQLALRS